MKKSSVCGIIVNNYILLLKRQFREGKLNGWCLPGGKQDPEDQSDEITAIREVFEETGIKINLPVYVGNCPSKSNEFDVSVFYTVMGEKHPVTLSEREHSDYDWVPIDWILVYDEYLAGNTKEFIKLILQNFGN
jgi:8-oxo-dGTP pyrophosphatase MutT (NUDIX family)